MEPSDGAHTTLVFGVTIALLTVGTVVGLPLVTSLFASNPKHAPASASASASASPAVSTLAFLPLLRPYFWPAHTSHRYWMTVTWVSLVLSHVCTSAVPLLLGDLAAALASTSAQVESQPVVLLHMLAVAGASLGEVLFRELMYYGFVQVKTAAKQELSVSTFAHMLSLDMGFHHTHPPHTMLRVLDRGVTASATIVNRLLLTFFPAVFAVFAMCAVFWRKFEQHNLAMLVAGSLVPYALISRGLTYWRATAYRKTSASSDTSSTFANDVMSHVSVVQLATAESPMTDHYRLLVLRHAEQYSTAWLIAQAGHVVKRLVLSVVLGVGLVMTARQVQAGQLGAGEFVTIATYILQVYRPLSRMDREFEGGIKAVVEVKQLAEVLATPPAVSDPVSPASLPPSPTDDPAAPPHTVLQFDHVGFTHPNTTQGVSDVSFSVASGSFTALCGANGCGKSTLFGLVTRLLSPATGCVRLCDVDVSSLRACDLRRAVVTSDQSISLFNMSMRQNITLGVSPSVPQTVVDAAVADTVTGLLLDDVVAQLPDGLDSKLGASGEGLSGGQQQRVVLARAMLRLLCPDPDVRPRVLLLDESTSALDPQAEVQVLRFVAETCRRLGCAVVFVTHRLSALPPLASLVVVMTDGQVAGIGSHDGLLETPGAYKDMWDAQRQE